MKSPFRYVVHPAKITRTPSRLRELLNASGMRAYSGKCPEMFLFAQDLFLIYPNPECIADRDTTYDALYGFFSRHKFGQRLRIGQAGLPIPATRGRKSEPMEASPFGYVVRPLRHKGGENYTLTKDPDDFTEGEQYISAIFPKTRELRIIWSMGDHVVTIEKRPGKQNIEQTQPWNAARGSTLETIANDGENPLLKTDIVTRLRHVEFLKYAHVVGIDVLMDDRARYVVLEFNACPGLVPANAEKIASHLRSKRSS